MLENKEKRASNNDTHEINWTKLTSELPVHKSVPAKNPLVYIYPERYNPIPMDIPRSVKEILSRYKSLEDIDKQESNRS